MADQLEDIARSYSENHPLTRPKMTYLIFGCKWIVVTFFLLGISHFGIQYLIDKFGFVATHHKCFYVVCCIVLLISTLRWFCIDCIKLYQHYADEDVRRRCRMMPSCSEYAILSLQKYGLILGLFLTYVRLYKRCKGEYIVEYPSLKNLRDVFI